MALNTDKKIMRHNQNIIFMPDTIITQINILGKNQPEQLIFTNHHGQLIRDIEIPGVDPVRITNIEPDNIKKIIETPELDIKLPVMDTEMGDQEIISPKKMGKNIVMIYLKKKVLLLLVIQILMKQNQSQILMAQNLMRMAIIILNVMRVINTGT